MEDKPEYKDYNERSTKQAVLDHVIDQLEGIDEDKLLGVAVIISISGDTASDTDVKLIPSATGRWRQTAAFNIGGTITDFFGKTIEGFKEFAIGKLIGDFAKGLKGKPLF